jgi:hypothetical protein
VKGCGRGGGGGVVRESFLSGRLCGAMSILMAVAWAQSILEKNIYYNCPNCRLKK